jgi:hypothetical protein
LGLVAKACRTTQRLMRKPMALTCVKVLNTFKEIAKASICEIILFLWEPFVLKWRYINRKLEKTHKRIGETESSHFLSQRSTASHNISFAWHRLLLDYRKKINGNCLRKESWILRNWTFETDWTFSFTIRDI